MTELAPTYQTDEPSHPVLHRYLVPYVYVNNGRFTFGETVLTFQHAISTLGDVNQIRAGVCDVLGQAIPLDHVVILNLIKLPV